MKKQEVTLNDEEDILVYLVYFTDTELPVAMFWDMELAQAFCQYFTHAFTDKEIRTANAWNIVGPLFRDRTQFVTRITTKNPEDEGLT